MASANLNPFTGRETTRRGNRRSGRDEKFVRTNFSRLFRISYTRHHPAGFLRRRRIVSIFLLRRDEMFLRSKQRYVTCIISITVCVTYDKVYMIYNIDIKAIFFFS